MQILIVDDDADSRRLLSVNLRWGGHDVFESVNGEAGWLAWQENHYRLIITDWMMPDVTGPELIRRIRGANANHYTYIILLTALGDKPQVVMGLEAGADDYLTKPFYPDELLERVSIGERIIKLEERLSESRRQMEFLAMHDGLTGVLNRRAIQERLDAELNRAHREKRPVGIAILDIDHFKSINDQHGHQIGDQALRLVADLLAKHVRPYDAIGRWGGEEFLIILPGANLAEVQAIAERIRAGLAEAQLPLPDSTTLTVQASLGVTCASSGATGEGIVDRLVQCADEALYCAKRDGRNRVCHSECVDL